MASSAEAGTGRRHSSFWENALNVAAREAAASAGAGISVDSVFYSLDSYKTHAQSAKGAGKFGLAEFRGLFRGFVPVVLSGSGERETCRALFSLIFPAVFDALFRSPFAEFSRKTIENDEHMMKTIENDEKNDAKLTSAELRRLLLVVRTAQALAAEPRR